MIFCSSEGQVALGLPYLPPPPTYRTRFSFKQYHLQKSLFPFWQPTSLPWHTEYILVLIPAHHQRERRRCDCYSNPLGSLMGKSEWEWGIRGLWQPIYSVISQLTVSAMAGLPKSLLKTWQGPHMMDRLWGAGEEGVRGMQEREEMERKRRAM